MNNRRPSPSRPDELEDFKSRINLTHYAATIGYVIDRKEFSRNSAVMRHPSGDKVVIAKDEDGHWIFFSVRDANDNGSIIDFIQRREGGTLGDVRKTLRAWLGTTPPPAAANTSPEAYISDLRHIRKDVMAVRVQYAAMQPIDGQHAYLEKTRQIPPHVLTDPRFADRMRVDSNGNAVFPHYNRDGLCGFELKNHNFTSFATGGNKGLWFSRIDTADRHLIIAESAIDALSYAALHYRPGSRFVSIAGELSPDQGVLLSRTMEKMPDGSDIILAVDHDAPGTKIGGRIKEMFEALHRTGLTLSEDRPPIVGNDWNDVLRGPTAPDYTAPSLRPRPPR